MLSTCLVYRAIRSPVLYVGIAWLTGYLLVEEISSCREDGFMLSSKYKQKTKNNKKTRSIVVLDSEIAAIERKQNLFLYFWWKNNFVYIM